MAPDAELLQVPAELLAAAAVLPGPGLLVVAVPQVLAEPFRRGPTMAETEGPLDAEPQAGRAVAVEPSVGAEFLAGLAWEVDGERLAGAGEQPRI